MHIKVTPITVPIGQEYFATSYPADGLYLVNGNQAIHRYTTPGGAPCSISVYMLESLVEDAPAVEPLPAQTEFAPAEFAPAFGISEVTLLKALAITANPDLAVQLLT